MTFEEARAIAIRHGALEPKGWKERMAAGNMAYRGGSFADTPLAQSRLEAWTNAILNGVDPRELT